MSLYIDGKRVLTDTDFQIPIFSSQQTYDPLKDESMGSTSIDIFRIYMDKSIYLVKGKSYKLFAKTNGNFTSVHNTSAVSNNVVLWFTKKGNANATIVSSQDTANGNVFTWTGPTDDYYLRVNTYNENDSIKVWDVKVYDLSSTIATLEDIWNLKKQIDQNGGGVNSPAIYRLYKLSPCLEVA